MGVNNNCAIKDGKWLKIHTGYVYVSRKGKPVKNTLIFFLS